ncbi:hypothetical protein [Butyricimonas synergistica]|uniref:hypothetical protein n=1 Tax=Butyricimonas synergistica TaxID=544644 RepID=UPI00036A1200|nr:hypothetical protein [Butyricimonas synergistica]
MPIIDLEKLDKSRGRKTGDDFRGENDGIVTRRSRSVRRVQMVNHVWTALNIFKLQPAWQNEAKRREMKGKNLFMQETYFAYDANMRIGMYNAMHFSTGNLVRLRNPRLVDNEDGSCTLTWQPNVEGKRAFLDDRLRVIVLRESNPDVFAEIAGITARRADGQVTFHARDNKELSGAAHLYAFFMSADGKEFSPDEHFVSGWDEPVA